MKKILIIYLALFTLNSFSQTKQQCINSIKLIDRAKEQSSWISTTMKDTKLIRRYRMKFANMFYTQESIVDMKYVEAVIIEYNEEYNSWYPTLLLDGNHCKERELNDDGTIDELSPNNRKAYYFFTNKTDAIKAQKVFIQLAKLCGATLIN